MGPYCNYCGTRCFTPTSQLDYVKTDLRATCTDGTIHDLNMTYSRLFNSKNVHIGWLLELRRHDSEGYSLALDLDMREYEIANTDLEEILDLTAPPKLNHYYRCK